MAALRTIAPAAFLLGLGLLPASAGGMWSIFWMSAPLPCSSWGRPIISEYNRVNCSIGPYTICPNPEKSSDPFDQGKPITVVGYQLSQVLSDPTAQGFIVVGSAHSVDNTRDGADVFASGAGRGNWTTSKTLGAGLSQGRGDNSYFDVYASCTTGTQQIMLVIEYTTP